MEELWKPIPGYEDIYLVSNTGKVKRDNHFLQTKQSGDYWYVYLTKDGKGIQANLRNILNTCFDDHVLRDCSLNLDGEVWRDVPEFEDAYEVSNFGRIRTKLRVRRSKGNSTAVVSQHIRVLCDDDDGYQIVSLYHGSISITRSVHRLVAKAFIPNPNNLPQVNHKDGNKHNNCVENLEWVTNLENIQHSVRIGIRDYQKIGAASAAANGIKLRCVDTGETFNSIKALADVISASYDSIRKAIHKDGRYMYGGNCYVIIEEV